MTEEDPTTLEEYRDLTPQQRTKVKKPALQGIIDSLLNNNSDNEEGGVVLQKLEEILKELKDIKSKYKNYDVELKKLNETVRKQNKVLEAQQNFLEDIDYERRSHDLIILGLKERDDDQVKFSDVLRTIQVDPNEVKVNCMRRLGKREEGEGEVEKNRPLKVTLEKKEMRSEILKNAIKLKDLAKESPFKKVYLKPDVHPEIRKEEKRLFDVYKGEKDNRDNVGMDVLYDRKKRIVTCNGEVIDRFRLFSSFR